MSIHLHRARGHYIGQVRKSGHRLWQLVTQPCDSPEAALSFLAEAMAGMKRGRVLFIDDSGYYEPTLVMEINRK